MNTDLLIQRIALLCEQRGITMTTAFIESKVGKNFKSNLKTANPSHKNLELLAQYFNVSVGYLTGEETDEDIASKATELVIEWLEDNEYEITENEYGVYTIYKNGKMHDYTQGELMQESLHIKALSENGFELAMRDWERRIFENHQIINDHSNNHYQNSINESPNATLTINGDGLSKQEKELIEMYRDFSIEDQLKLLSLAFELRGNK